MGRTGWHFTTCALIVVLAAIPALGDDDPVGAATAEAREALLHPLAHIRARAEKRIAGDGGSQAVVRELQRDRDPRLRAAAWSILVRRPEWCRAAEARAALDDTCPRVRLSAGRALLQRLTSGREAQPPLPGEMSWTPEGRKAVTHALIERCEHSAADQPIPCLLRAGEGITAALGEGARTRTASIRIRRRLVSALGRIGSVWAGEELLKLLQTPETFPDRAHLFSTLADVRLNPSQRARLFKLLRGPDEDPKRAFRQMLRKRRWRERGAMFRALDANATETVRALLLDYMRSSLQDRGPLYPERAVDATRILVRDAEELSDATVLLMVSRCSPHRRWRGRDEHYGEVLRLLEPVSDRAVFIEALAKMLEDEAEDETEASLFTTSLPISVEAWARYYVGEADETMRVLATTLIRGENGEIPVWEARRAGARIWRRIGPPPVPLIREFLGDADPILRREGLAWIGELPEDEAASTLETARQDESDGVRLEALRNARLPLTPADGGRLVDLLLRGRRLQRLAACRVLFETWPDPLTEAALEAGDLAIDERLRIAGLLDAHWKAQTASDAGLPNPKDR